jgi:hypothetical protein
MNETRSTKSASVTRLDNGMFRVGRNTHSIVRTLNADQLAEWEASPLNWTSFRPTPAR